MTCIHSLQRLGPITEPQSTNLVALDLQLSVLLVSSHLFPEPLWLCCLSYKVDWPSDRYWCLEFKGKGKVNTETLHSSSESHCSSDGTAPQDLRNPCHTCAALDRFCWGDLILHDWESVMFMWKGSVCIKIPLCLQKGQDVGARWYSRVSLWSNYSKEQENTTVMVGMETTKEMSKWNESVLCSVSDISYMLNFRLLESHMPMFSLYR